MAPSAVDVGGAVVAGESNTSLYRTTFPDSFIWRAAIRYADWDSCSRR
jgi:hypothetical protein